MAYSEMKIIEEEKKKKKKKHEIHSMLFFAVVQCSARKFFSRFFSCFDEQLNGLKLTDINPKILKPK